MLVEVRCAAQRSVYLALIGRDFPASESDLFEAVEPPVTECASLHQIELGATGCFFRVIVARSANDALLMKQTIVTFCRVCIIRSALSKLLFFRRVPRIR